MPDQIIDYTHSRKSTYFEGSENPVIHVDFTMPYTAALRAGLGMAEAMLQAGGPRDRPGTGEGLGVPQVGEEGGVGAVGGDGERNRDQP